MAADNKTLGRFQLTDIPPAPRGVPQIEVSFNIDANGIVNITAKDKGTGKEQSITITSDTNLSEDEIEKMIKDAEANKAADEAKKAEIESLNQAEQTLYSIDKTLEDCKEFVTEEEKAKLEGLKEELQTLLNAETKDVEAIKAKEQEVITTLQPIVTKMYQQASEQAQAEQANEASQSSDDEVVDAEIEE